MRSLVSGTIASYGLKKRAEPVVNCRRISKRDMKHNDSLPAMEGESWMAGRHVWSPETQQRHFHFQQSTLRPMKSTQMVYYVMLHRPPKSPWERRNLFSDPCRQLHQWEMDICITTHVKPAAQSTAPRPASHWLWEAYALKAVALCGMLIESLSSVITR